MKFRYAIEIYTILYNPISFLGHIDSSTTSGGSLTTAYISRTSTETTPKFFATSTFANETSPFSRKET